MSFENIQRDLKAYEGRKQLSLDEMLALYRSLEGDLNRLTGGKMDKYALTEAECQSDSLIGSLTWLGSLFAGLYGRNQAQVCANAGKIAKRRLEDAQRLTLELEQLRQLQDQADTIKKENEALEGALEQLRRDTRDTAAAQKRHQDLTAQVAEARLLLEQTSPFDIAGAAAELNRLQTQLEALRESNQKAQQDFERQNAAARQELAELQAAEKDQRLAKQDLTDRLTAARQAAAAREEENTALSRELAGLKAQADSLSTDITQRQQERDRDKQNLTNLQLRLAQLTDSNESFRRTYIDPVKTELDQAQKAEAALTSERDQALERLKDLTEQIQKLQTVVPNLNNQIDAQTSNLKAAETNMEAAQESLNALTTEFGEKEAQKKALDSQIAELQTRKLTLTTEISTLELQTIPGLRQDVARKEKEKADLGTQLPLITSQIAVLQGEIDEKAREVGDQAAIKADLDSKLRRLSAELDDLVKTNQELKEALEEGNPEEAKEKLARANQNLLEQIAQLEQVRLDLTQKEADITQTAADLKEKRQALTQKQAYDAKLQADCADLDRRLAELAMPEHAEKGKQLDRKRKFLEEVSRQLRVLSQKLPQEHRQSGELEQVRQSLIQINNQLTGIQDQLLLIRRHYKENIL